MSVVGLLDGKTPVLDDHGDRHHIVDIEVCINEDAGLALVRYRFVLRRDSVVGGHGDQYQAACDATVGQFGVVACIDPGEIRLSVEYSVVVTNENAVNTLYFKL